MVYANVIRTTGAYDVSSINVARFTSMPLFTRFVRRYAACQNRCRRLMNGGQAIEQLALIRYPMDYLQRTGHVE